ncbi:MAG: ABC transporter ATP-binding protein [Caldilineaceae bacterium]
MNPLQLWRRLVRFRPGLFTLSLTFYVCYTLSLAFSGLILRAFFDRLADAPGALALSAIVLLQLGNSLLAMMGLSGANTIGFYHLDPSIRALLFSNIFAHILARPGAQPLPVNEGNDAEMSVGVALNTLRDDVQQIFVFDIELADLFGFGLTALIAFVAMLQVSIPITLGVFAPLIAIVLITSRLRKRIERYREASREATSRAAGAIGEIFGAVQAIQVNNAEARVIAHFRRLNEARRQTSVRDQLLTRLVDALAGNMVVIGTALVLILAARAMAAGRFTVGDFALFVAYIWPVTVLFQNIANQLALYQQTGVSIRRLQRLMQDAPPEQLATPAPIYLTGPLPALPARPALDSPLEILEARDLTYLHPHSGQGIENVNLQIKQGTLTVISGRVGAGKSTLLRVLLGLLPKDEGKIRWNGQIVDEPASFFVPPRSAYAPQTPRLFSESLRDNILMGMEEQVTRWQGEKMTGELAERAADAAVLGPDVAAMEEGLDTLVGPRGVRLSGGQVQRTAAARVFARQPELLVFDDLSSALDVETEWLLWEKLFGFTNYDLRFTNSHGDDIFDFTREPHADQQLVNEETNRKSYTRAESNRSIVNRTSTYLVVSHRRLLLQLADHIVVLKDGRVEDEGMLEELLARCAEMQRLWLGEEEREE